MSPRRADSTWSAAAAIASEFARSRATKSTWRPSSAACLVSATGSGLRPKTITSAPASNSASEMPSPRPRPPPVTTAVLPLRSKGVLIVVISYSCRDGCRAGGVAVAVFWCPEDLGVDDVARDAPGADLDDVGDGAAFEVDVGLLRVPGQVRGEHDGVEGGQRVFDG